MMKLKTLSVALITLFACNALVFSFSLLVLTKEFGLSVQSLDSDNGGLVLRLFGALVVPCLLVLAIKQARHTIRRHDAQLREAQRLLALANLELNDKVAYRTRELERATGEMALRLKRLRLMQAKMVQQEKLAALGGLVAGVAHELNTPIGNGLLAVTTLSELVGRCQVALECGMKRSALIEHLRLSQHSCELLHSSLHRAAELIASFKLVDGKHGDQLRQRFDLATLLDAVMTMRRGDLQQASCTVQLQVATGLLFDSYPDSVVRVFNSLIDNALLHAFDGRVAGRISISAHEADLHTVRIEVIDDGVGMAPQVLQRIFDPFFTTRIGRGACGLGMTIVHNLVTGMLGGQIDVRTAQPAGTLVEIVLHKLAPLHSRWEPLGRAARLANGTDKSAAIDDDVSDGLSHDLRHFLASVT